MIDKGSQALAIRSPRGGRSTEVDWADGHRSVYPHARLRGYCPCAACQGHSGVIEFREANGIALELESIAPVGNYAVQLTWFDGHESGIYAYTYLRSLCGCEACSSVP